jgi:hypothetical protein
VIGSWCFGGLIAVITGHVARHQIKQTGEAGATLALVGLIAGYAAIALTLLPFCVRGHASRHIREPYPWTLN